MATIPGHLSSQHYLLSLGPIEFISIVLLLRKADLKRDRMELNAVVINLLGEVGLLFGEW